MSDQAFGESNKLVAPFLVAGAVMLGVFMPSLSSAVFPFIFIALFFVVVFSLCGLDRCPTEVLFPLDSFSVKVVAWQLIGLPALLLALRNLVYIPDSIAVMMLATITASSVFAGPALVGMLGLDRRQATRCMVISTFCMPISLLVFGELMGVIPASISISHYIRQINFFLIIPMIIALLYWTFRDRLSGNTAQKVSKSLNWCATLSLMVFCVGAMHSISSADEHQLVRVLSYGVIAILLSMTLFSVTAMVFSHLGSDHALLAGMLSANRNVALSAAFLDQIVTSDLMVYVAVSQFPIFMFPLAVQLTRWARLGMAKA